MAVKFPLKMADGATVRTIKKLQNHFDFAAVLAYYENGRLVRWLENGYYEEEARKVAALDSALPNFAEKICEILGVNRSASERAQVDFGDISERNKRIERLKQFTVDDEILVAVDRVAFTQEDMDDLASKYGHPVRELYQTKYIAYGDEFQENKVHLCGGYFTIPSDKCAVVCIGVNRPTIALSPVVKPTPSERLPVFIVDRDRDYSFLKCYPAGPSPFSDGQSLFVPRPCHPRNRCCNLK